MKKITFYFLLLTCMLQIHAQSNVTFSVDMSGQTGFTTVYVSGSLNGWSGDADPLSDADGDGIWETTLTLDDGFYQYKFTLDNWSGEETLQQSMVGTVTNSGFTNRFLNVGGSDISLPTVPYGGSNVAPGPYSVTFNVDMSNYPGSFTNVNLNGQNHNEQGLGSWCGDCITMADDDGDNIYSATVPLEAYSYEFKFTTDGWTSQEEFDADVLGTVTNGGFTNRFLSVDRNMVINAVWNQPEYLTPSSTPEGIWKLSPQAGAFGYGPAAGDTQWYSSSEGDVTLRDCFFDDQFVFSNDGSFQNVQDDETWIEGWQGGTNACGTPVAPHDGSNAATWAYDSTSNTITLTGSGAHLGLAKAINGDELDGVVAVPESIVYNVISISETDMTVAINVGGGFWTFVFTKVISGSDATLSSIEVDGIALSGFSPNATDYNYFVSSTATVAPIVTATLSDSNASISITQASDPAGLATIEVTSANTSNNTTYTVDFLQLDAAPTPPSRAATDVVSLYSDAYTNSTNWGSIELFGGTLTDVVIDGNNTYEMTSGFQYNYYTPPGTFEDLSDMTHMHVDFYVAGDFVDGSVLGIQLLGLEANQGGSGENTFTQTAFQSYSWVSVDVPFADFNNAASVSPLYEDIKLIQVNLQAPAGATLPTVYLDNFYFYREASAGLDDNVFNAVKMFPNPAKDTVQFSVNSNENLDIEIFDMLGKSVLRVNAVQNEVNIADLNSGLYFVQMTLGTQQATKKLIVN